MKLDSRTGNVISSGSIGEDSNFTIEMNPKMFRTLSDTMYQDKIGSMIRELSCNAMDAHIAAGEADKPFTIHLPDQIEPWFSVKDEGIGLSDQDIRSMYTSYGASTKDQSNDMVGAFGLGSKTPFAYTDQFTVTSIYDGMKRVYVAVMVDELPVIKLQHEEETSEHPGLEVNVGVNDYDFSTFRDKVLAQLRFFKVKPTLLNNRYDVQFKDLDALEALIERDGIKVFKQGYRDDIRGIWVVQGGVGYILSIEKLGDMEDAAKSFAKAIAEKGAVIRVDIGDVEVTASREGISYTENTRKRIVKRLTDVANAISAETVAELRKMTSIWERAAAFNGLMEVLQKAVKNSADFDKLFPENVIAFRGQNMIVRVKQIDDMGLDAVMYVKHKGYRRGSYSDTFVRLARKVVTDLDRSWDKDIVNLHPEVDFNVFIRDTNSKPVARLKLFAEENDYPPMLVIEGFKGDVTKAEIKKVAKALHIPESKIKLLSTLTAPKVNNSGKGGAEARPRAFQMPTSGSVNIGNSREWERVYDNLDDIDEAIWVKMDRHDISWSSDVRIVLEAAKRGLLDKPVIAVNYQTADRITEGKVGSQLTSAEDVAKELLAKIESFKPIYRALEKYNNFIGRVGSGNRHVRAIINNGAIPGLDAVSKRIEQLEKRIEGWEWAERNSDADLMEAAGKAGYNAGEARNMAIVDRYPLLSHLQPYTDIPAEHIEDYIKMVDERG